MEEEEMMYMKFIEIKNLMKKRSNEFKPMTEKELKPNMKILKDKMIICHIAEINEEGKFIMETIKLGSPSISLIRKILLGTKIHDEEMMKEIVKNLEGYNNE